MSVSEALREGLTGQEMDIFIKFKPRTECEGRALGLALVAHRNQRRRSQELYIHHPIAVQRIWESWGVFNPEISAAALLHDTVEDTETTLEELTERFGKRVSNWVDGVSNLKTHLASHRKTATRTVQDPVNGAMKLADRYHNLETLRHMPADKQIAKAEDTLAVHRELAGSLGMWKVREEMSDMAFRYANPEAHNKLKAEIAEDPRTSEMLLAHYRSKIELLLKTAEIEGEVSTRFKGCYSTFLKREQLVSRGKCRPDSLEGINDLVSFGIVVTDLEACYQVLGQLHNAWDGPVLVEDFKDRIANPPDNGYRALQISIVTPFGPIEIAVMTKQMQDFNDWGIISKLRKGEDVSGFSLKPVFLSSGRVLFLPIQSTGVDLVARQDPALFRRMPQIQIDGTDAPITTVLPVGALVDVRTGSDVAGAVDEQLVAYCSRQTQRLLQELIVGDQKAAIAKEGHALIQAEISQRGLLFLSDLGPTLIDDIIQTVDKHQGDIHNLKELEYLVGGGFLKLGKLSEILDTLGITREQMALHTIQVTGSEDHPGILKLLVSRIHELGGNIKNLITVTENGFVVRVLVQGIQHTTGLQQELSVNTWFSEVQVV